MELGCLGQQIFIKLLEIDNKQLRWGTMGYGHNVVESTLIPCPLVTVLNDDEPEDLPVEK